MRELGPMVIVYNALLIVAILFICMVNAYALIRIKRHFLTIGLHIVSFFLLLGLFSSMMVVVIIDLPLEAHYKRMGTVSYGLFAISLLVVSGIYLLKKRNPNDHDGLPQDLASVVNSAQDLIVVADYRGMITQVNHWEKLKALCDMPNTLVEVLENLGLNETNAPLDINNGYQGEACFEALEAYYHVRVLPIKSQRVIIGYTAIIEDISEIRRSEKRLKETNDERLRANEKLAHSVIVAGALEAESERLKILDQIQNALIENIESSVSKVRQIQGTLSDSRSSKKEIKELSEQLRSVYKVVRESIGKIAGKEG